MAGAGGEGHQDGEIDISILTVTDCRHQRWPQFKYSREQTFYPNFSQFFKLTFLKKCGSLILLNVLNQCISKLEQEQHSLIGVDAVDSPYKTKITRCDNARLSSDIRLVWMQWIHRAK